MEPKKMLIYTSLGIFLAGAGGLSAYQFYQKEPTATKVENEEPEKTTDLPKEEAKTVKTDEIRLNTDDNQLIDDKKEETVALETEEPTPIKGFSIKDTVDNIIYVLNPKRVEAQSPIEKLVVDPEDSEFPEEEVPELPRNPEDLLDGIISPKDPEQQPETPELPPNNELPKDEDKPGKGKEPGESKPEEPKEPEHPKPNDPEKPKDPEKPGQPDPEEPGQPDPDSTVIDLIVDGDTWKQVEHYIEEKDFYNVMYYGQRAKTDQEKFNETVECFLRNMIDYELNFQEKQLFASLNFQNTDSDFLTDYQAVVKESLFKEFVEGEVNLYITRSESDGEQNDVDDAKQVVYYVGKYNEQAEDEQLDLPENAKEHLKNAGELLVEGAQVEEDEGNVDRIVEALNKAQIAIAYAPGVKEQAEEAKAQALEQLAESIEPEDKENKQPNEEKETEKQQGEGNTQSSEKGQQTPSQNEEQEKASEDEQAEEEQPKSDPLLEKAQVAAGKSNYIQAVMLASESLAKGNTEAQANLNDFASKLFEAAKQSDRNTAEQAFEVLSTTQGVPANIASQAFSQKKAISYAKKAEEKLDGIKGKDIQTQQAIYREVVNNKTYISPKKVEKAEEMLKEINIYQAAMKQASSPDIDFAIRVLDQAINKVKNEELKKALRAKREELSNKQKKTASNREEKEKKDSASDTVTQESNEKK